MILVFILCMCLVYESSAQNNISCKPAREQINRIVARINGENLLLSDLKMPQITKDGECFSLDEAINNALLYQKAIENNMLPTAMDIDRNLISFKMQNNFSDLSDAEFEQQLQTRGFTLREYKRQLGQLLATENIKRAEMSEKIIVTSQEVEDYYKAYPEKTLTRYHIKVCTVKKTVTIIDDTCEWEDLGWIYEKDMDQDLKKEIPFLNVGSISKAFVIDNIMCQYIKLVNKDLERMKTLDERYVAIERLLQEKKRTEYISSFEKNLRKNACVLII